MTVLAIAGAWSMAAGALIMLANRIAYWSREPDDRQYTRHVLRHRLRLGAGTWLQGANGSRGARRGG